MSLVIGAVVVATGAGLLATCAAAGLAVAPAMLRRMARRQSGSEVEAAREQAMQWVR